MATNWDLEMQERFEKLEATVGEIGKRFDGVDRRLDAVERRFDGVDRRLDDMSKRFDTVDRGMTEIEDRLSRKIDVQMDNVRELVQKAAEGYGATLEGIARELKEFHSEWWTKATDTDIVLLDHGRRITALEERTSK